MFPMKQTTTKAKTKRNSSSVGLEQEEKTNDSQVSQY